MEPIFARLGVWHESRNFGNGGMGTSHHALAAGSMYGPDVSLLMWDSGMFSNKCVCVYSRLCIADADSMIDKFLAAIRLHLFEGMTEKGANAHELFARQ